jgi:hypothetical protein
MNYINEGSIIRRNPIVIHGNVKHWKGRIEGWFQNGNEIVDVDIRLRENCSLINIEYFRYLHVTRGITFPVSLVNLFAAIPTT